MKKITILALLMLCVLKAHSNEKKPTDIVVVPASKLEANIGKKIVITNKHGKVIFVKKVTTGRVKSRLFIKMSKKGNYNLYFCSPGARHGDCVYK